MSEQQSSYRQIFKATSIFGGVQVFQIILSIVRSKFVAVLLGAQGMGISGLFLSVTTLISGITGMGISVSAVRNISEANGTGDEKRIAHVAAVVKKLALITGMLGAFITIVLSPWLSRATFGNDQYTWSFIALSVTFLLGSLASSQSVLLQGLSKLSSLAKANVLGATVGLAVSIPLYYLYGLTGIVPAIILSAVATTFFAYFFGRRVVIQKTEPVSFSEAWREGKGMISMGIMLTLSAVIAAVSAYVLRLFINQQGSLVDVGLYSAGFAIVNTYVGMIFTAMSTDYYPRLSAVANDSVKANMLVNQQAEMALLILGPVLILFLIVLKFAIVLLYSAEFLACVEMVQWAVLAIFFKALTWSMGFLLLSKGKSKIFFWNELAVNIYTLFFNVIGYYYYGIEGIGLSFFVAYLFATIQNTILLNVTDGFLFNLRTYSILFIHFLPAIACLILVRSIDISTFYLISPLLCFLSIIYSFKELNKRMNILDKLKAFLK